MSKVESAPIQGYMVPLSTGNGTQRVNQQAEPKFKNFLMRMQCR